MGCCQYTRYMGPSGFILPDQELLIHELEQSHPFSAFEAGQLFEAFSVWGTSGELHETDFFSACESLSIQADTFFSINSPWSLYMHELKTSPKMIDIQKLLVTGILLSRSDWECKFSFLLLVYEFNGKPISIYSLCFFLNQLIYASTCVLPSMSLVYISKKKLNSYVEQIASLSSTLIDKVTTALGELEEVPELKLFEFLREMEHFQKLFWSNGIRIMLVEEDTLPSASDTSRRALPIPVNSSFEKSEPFSHSGDATKIQSVRPSFDINDAESTQIIQYKNSI